MHKSSAFARGKVRTCICTPQSHTTVVGITKESNVSKVSIFVKSHLIIALTLIRRSIYGGL